MVWMLLPWMVTRCLQSEGSRTVGLVGVADETMWRNGRCMVSSNGRTVHVLFEPSEER